jgi:hypothetical protein
VAVLVTITARKAFDLVRDECRLKRGGRSDSCATGSSVRPYGT